MGKRAFVGAILLALAAFAAGCDQPKPKCAAAHGNFAATFKLVSGDGPCAELESGILNVQSYNDPKSDSDPVLDPNKPTLAIQTQETTDVLWSGRETDPDEKPFAFGAFDKPDPDDEGFCTVRSLSLAVLRADATEAVPEMMIDECTIEPAQPAMDAIDISYKWRNVRVVMTPRAIGTKFEADLEYTVDGCTAEYEVAAVWPLVECGSPVEGGEDEPLPDAGEEEEPAASDEDAGVDAVDSGCPPAEEPEPMPELEADDELCESQTMIPDFPVTCDPALLMCVLDD
jgi:hypothetical protein